MVDKHVMYHSISFLHVYGTCLAHIFMRQVFIALFYCNFQIRLVTVTCSTNLWVIVQCSFQSNVVVSRLD